MFLKADIVNGMINTMIVETIVFMFVIFVINNLFHIDKTQKIKIAVASGIKILIINPAMTYIRNIGYDKEPYIYWIVIVNLLVFVIYMAYIKMVSREDYVIVVGVVSLMFDAIVSLIIMVPYNLVTKYVMKSEPVFFGKNFNTKNILIYVVFIIYCVAVVIMAKYLTGKYSENIRKLIYRAKYAVYVLFVADLAIGPIGYAIKSLYYDWRIFAYYIAMFFAGGLILYEASLYVRKRKAKEVVKENIELNTENETIKEYYHSLSIELEKDKKFRHDLDKHMNVIKEMVDEGASEEEVKEYADSIKETYK